MVLDLSFAVQQRQEQRGRKRPRSDGPILQASVNDTTVRLAPDGYWLAYGGGA
jgi:hypothetical protein